MHGNDFHNLALQFRPLTGRAAVYDTSGPKD